MQMSCSAEELFNFKDKFDRVFQEQLHDGEKEALVLLKKKFLNEGSIMRLQGRGVKK